MDKPYDLKDLANRLKADGLTGLEESAEKAYGSLKSWLKDSAKLSSMPYDDMLVAFIDQLDAIVLPQIEKISPDHKTETEA